MDDASKIETFKAWLRLKFTDDAAGLAALLAYITALGDGAAGDAVVMTSHNFADGGSSGQLVLEPMTRFNAALTVLAERDPTQAAVLAGPGKTRFADFSCMPSES